MTNNIKLSDIKAIIGLGNPGATYRNTRHNIGFQVLDKLADRYNAVFKDKENFQIAEIYIETITENLNNLQKILLIKPQTFMNNSGQVMRYLKNQNIKTSQILVIHDELELNFGKIAFKFSGSSKGHNGLKSIMANAGPDFWRLRFGISRPEDRSQVSDYVLQNFNKDQAGELDNLIDQAINLILSS